MASKERIQRLKDQTRQKILDAAFKIVKEEGWQALSMRKIADLIEYSPPIIYEYFSGKEGLVLVLAKNGFNMLAVKIRQAQNEFTLPAEQLKAMWLAYWDFAMSEKELYQVMFGVEMVSCEPQKTFLEADKGYQMYAAVIAELLESRGGISSEELSTKFYTFWSVIHGLVSINMVRTKNSDELNHQILNDAIDAIISSMQN